MERSRLRACPSLSALVLGALVFTAAFEGAEERAAPFEWRDSYSEGLSAAREARRPLLVYFPPVSTEGEPSAMRGAARALGAPPLVEGVRVGAAEVRALLDRFEVKRIPCLILLDRRENVVARWEGPLPGDLWTSLKAILRKMERRDREMEKEALEALGSARDGNAETAYRKVAPILASPVASPEAIAAAREVEAILVRRVWGRLLEILAREGIRADADVLADLEALRAGTGHGGLRKEIGREILRLRRGTVAGR